MLSQSRRGQIQRGFSSQPIQLLSTGKKLIVAPMDGELFQRLYRFCQQHDLNLDSTLEVFFERHLPKFLNQLESELKRAPPGELKFSCQLCGKSFPSRLALAGHMAVHSKLK